MVHELLFLAAAAGLVVNVTRLMDFRWTTRAARMRQLRTEGRPVGHFRPPVWLNSLDVDEVKKFAPTEANTCSPDPGIESARPSGGFQAKEPEQKSGLPAILRGLLKVVPQPAGSDTLDQTTWRTIGDYCRDRYDLWGRWTWWLLIGQFALFGVGIALLAVGVIWQPLGSSDDPETKNVEVVVEAKDEKPDASGRSVSQTDAVTPTTHTVVQGDTLGRIAKAFYRGDSARWSGIYERNRDVIGKDPNLLRPGQILTIPAE
jgi:hypothetical protein